MEFKITGWVHSHYKTGEATGFQCFNLSFGDELVMFEVVEFITEHCRSSDENDYLWEMIENEGLPVEQVIELTLKHVLDDECGGYLEITNIDKEYENNI